MVQVMMIFLSTLLFLVGCDQDPLKGQPDEVYNAKREGSESPKPRPYCNPDTLKITMSPSPLNFIEGIEGKATFLGEILGDCAQDYAIEIINLPEGAVFDADSKELTWTPPLDTVMGRADFVLKSLDVRIIALPESKGAFRGETFTYAVRRKPEERPEIAQVKHIGPFPLREGKNAKIKILVKDPDSNDGAVSTPPTLNLLMTTSDDRNAIPFIELADAPIRDSVDPELWYFEIDIRTQGLNVVNRNLMMQFGVKAFSRYGQASDKETIYFDIENRVGEPKISWPEASVQVIEMEVGKKNSYTFWAFDPLEEAETTASFVTNCKNLPGTAICECKHIGHNGHTEGGSFCKIEWDIPVGVTLKKQDFVVAAVNSNFLDTKDKREIRFNRQIRLIESVNPSPQGGSR